MRPGFELFDISKYPLRAVCVTKGQCGLLEEIELFQTPYEPDRGDCVRYQAILHNRGKGMAKIAAVLVSIFFTGPEKPAEYYVMRHGGGFVSVAEDESIRVFKETLRRCKIKYPQSESWKMFIE